MADGQQHKSVFDRILEISIRAEGAGWVPVAVEVGLDVERELVNQAGPTLSLVGAGRLLGLRVARRLTPGISILALPRRKIGRYEIVCPSRFEEAAA